MIAAPLVNAVGELERAAGGHGMVFDRDGSTEETGQRAQIRPTWNLPGLNPYPKIHGNRGLRQWI